MRSFFKWLLRGLLFGSVMILLVGIWERERLVRLLAVNSLFAEDRIVQNFTGMDSMFNTIPMPTNSEPVNRLPKGSEMVMPANFARWSQERAVTGMIVLKDGVIRHESYPLVGPDEGDPAQSLRIGWSMAKSFLSVLTGILVEDGTIPDLDAPVTDYVPTLAGSAYDGATVRNILQMSSGVTFDEDYLDFRSDINKMGRVLALGQSMDRFAENLDEFFAPAGAQWQYVSIDTHILGMVLRGATGRSIPDLLRQKVIAPLAPTVTPYYIADGHGVAFALGGINMSTHDYALFGQMIANGGTIAGTRVVSQGWIEESTAPSANTTPEQMGYGYQWWSPRGGPASEFMARGIYGQYTYVDQQRGVVIVVNAADRNFREPGVSEACIEMFRAIAQSLE